MTHPASSPRHHMVVRLPCGLGREPKRCIAVPIVLDTAQPVPHFADYVYACDKLRSVSWQRLQCLALGLYVDYQTACGSSHDSPTALFRDFADALRFGTQGQHGDDPLGLFWQPRRKRLVGRYLSAVTHFTDWVADRTGTARLNPMRQTTVGERQALQRAAGVRKAHALLGHAHQTPHTRGASSLVRTVNAGGSESATVRGVPRGFDETRFGEFLAKGFPRRGALGAHPLERCHLKDVMITLLLHGGGLRESEPFHLFTDDVLPDPHHPGSCIVRLFHPERGRPELVDRMAQPRVARRAQQANRESYLRDVYNREPRTLLQGSQHAGFKNLLLTDDLAAYAEVHWFPAFYGEVFWELYLAYLRLRPTPWNHPYLFVSERAGQRGEPYTIGAFQDAHRRAGARLGLRPSPSVGTHPHSHRHAYARRAKDAGLAPEIIRVMLHHRDPGSQDMYGTPDAARVAHALADAQARVDALQDAPSPLLRAAGSWRDARLQLGGWS